MRRLGNFKGGHLPATVVLQPDPLFQRLPDLLRGIASDEEEQGEETERTTLPNSDERKGPLLLPEPHVRQLQYRITLPAGFTPKSLPDSATKHYGPATISQKFEKEGDHVIVATFHLDTGSGRFTAEQVDDLRQAIMELSKDENTPWEVKIELENAAAADMAAVCGRPTGAGEGPRGPSPGDGDRALISTPATSRLLLKAGLGDARGPSAAAGRDRARSAVAYTNSVPRVATYDLLGRQFRPGMDWVGAAGAYQKALELDPSDVATRMDWAILLEHDTDGLRYAPGTRLDDAIEGYRKAQRQLGPRNRLDTLEVNLGLDLLYREKYVELEKLAARAEKSASWRGFLVAAVAARQGVSDADKRAAEIAPNADARREILQNAAEYLQQARLYAAAGTLYEAAVQGAEKPEELHTKAKTIAQLRRMEDADLAQDPPRHAMQELLCRSTLSGRKAAERNSGIAR